MSVRMTVCGPFAFVAALALSLVQVGGGARAADDPAKSASERRFCQTYPESIAPPGTKVRDLDGFCRCYAEAAEKAGLPALERAEANVGQDVVASDANRTRSIHARQSEAVARRCLTP